jgi:cycloeucalenol cycloisomerase
LTPGPRAALLAAVTVEAALAAPRPRLLAEAEDKRQNELFVLAYSPIWMAVIGAVMLTRRPAVWGDLEHMILGVGLALPLWIRPFLPRGSAERALPLLDRHATRFAIAIAIVTFLQTYFGTMLFFDRLGMEYHFNVTWSLHRTPVFLYFVTIAYFSTYYVVFGLVERAFAARFPGASKGARLLVRVVIAYVVAFGETFFMANEVLEPFFFYRDRAFMLRWGSIVYGTLFLVTLPFFARLDEDDRAPRAPLWTVIQGALAMNMLSLLCYEGYSLLLRPR